MIQIVYIPKWLPISLNKLITSHWAAAAKMKKECADLVTAYAIQHGITPATGKRRVSLHLVMPKGQRRIDADNSKKGIFDALVHCGALTNDSPKWVVDGGVSYSRTEDSPDAWGTYITLEDV